MSDYSNMLLSVIGALGHLSVLSQQLSQCDVCSSTGGNFGSKQPKQNAILNTSKCDQIQYVLIFLIKRISHKFYIFPWHTESYGIMDKGKQGWYSLYPTLATSTHIQHKLVWCQTMAGLLYNARCVLDACPVPNLVILMTESFFFFVYHASQIWTCQLDKVYLHI